MNNLVQARPEQTVIPTPRGPVVVQGPVDSAYLQTLVFNSGLDNFRAPERQHQALMTIADFYEGMVFVARHRKEIVGYVTFHYPDEHSRWRAHSRILELGSVEVSRDWRKLGLGRALVAEACASGRLEDFVTITTEYSWHWDLKGTGLDMWAYQRMLTAFFGQFGFVRRHTDDPEICEHPANVLMVRFGSRVSKEDISRFESMCFQKTLVRF
ncbi:MAG: GNAT family N-acetyltransferase [Desulfurispora sp.]|uniref:GNAT family N-acetyltransferase n=1 Tax=Desulfurispora sp. TaxID=3014275 RepID=UPI00404A349C